MKISRVKRELPRAVLKAHYTLDRRQAIFLAELIEDRLRYLRRGLGPHVSTNQVIPELSAVCFRYADSWGSKAGRPAPSSLFTTVWTVLVRLSEEDR